MKIGYRAAAVALLATLLVAPAARAEATPSITAGSAPAADRKTTHSAPSELLRSSTSEVVTPLGNCTAGVFCGEVKNRLGRSLKISGNWPSNTKTMMLPAGQGAASDSSYYYDFRDTDGFQVPSGYIYYDTIGSTYRPGWHRVRDYQEITLNAWCLVSACG
ncbi:hypothetical protein [Micromonospora sediminimaris]|uniref:Peptidase inhibitor family I36 n=1 Tax=Micromonospora sediminimaris TaxID=547162 RepID=A0A9W5UWY8_9ACTN|nr:hypothetical protein [Micromonospora sediminimaris]GIJ36160.1 hypothetical protein Vse01_53080 [Micromonospora sediminimaris]SFB84449.1 hypothetical protein SAMN05216284_101328 [Micromonospora sediminimaris]